ncbi:ATP-binding protein [Streptomyces sp. NPDC050523]|uniref:ATP-binding protein n=1 Tax=Streptomyces sp. NPDC050523 TaxID=3365622 RepID=UPI00379C6D92
MAWMAAEVEPDAMDLFGNPARQEVPLPARRESARTARQLTCRVLMQQWYAGDHVTDDVVLLVSELVTNVLQHTGVRVFGLRLRRHNEFLGVEVRDPSRGLPCLMPLAELADEGWGLYMVDRLADRWGVDLLPRGKTVWFEMRIRPAPGQP